MAALLDILKKGVTDRSVTLRIIDSTDGTPETGVVFNTSGIDLWYRREAEAKTSITEATLAALTTAHSDGGFLHVSDGEYRLDVPDAAFATGANYVDFGGTVTGMVVIGGRVRLVNVDLEDTVRFGLTCLPNGAVNSSGGLFTRGTGSGQINQPSNGTIEVVLTTAGINAVSDQVWDEATSGHVTSGSFGAAGSPTDHGTAQAGGANTITLRSGAVATDDYYNKQLLKIVAGTGAGQSEYISDYVGATKVVTMAASWAVAPDVTSVYVIGPGGTIPGASAPTAGEVADAVWDEARSGHVSAGSFGQYFAQIFRSGTAQGGAVGSITLDASASATNDLYKYGTCSIIGGTGAGQSRQINGYTGSSKIATVGVNWTVAPSSDSVFLLTPLGVDAATVAAISFAVWDELRAGHGTAGTYGEYVFADAVRLANNATAASNAKNTFDGSTGYSFPNSVIPTVTTVTGNIGGNVTGNVTGTVASVVGAVGSVTGNVGGNVVGSVASVIGNVGGNVVGSVASVTAAVTAGTVSDKTGYALSNAGIDALFTRQLTEAYAADGVAPTVAQALFLIQQRMTEFGIASTTMTIKKLDGSTTAATLTLNDASAPTAVTRAT